MASSSLGPIVAGECIAQGLGTQRWVPGQGASGLAPHRRLLAAQGVYPLPLPLGLQGGAYRLGECGRRGLRRRKSQEAPA